MKLLTPPKKTYCQLKQLTTIWVYTTLIIIGLLLVSQATGAAGGQQRKESPPKCTDKCRKCTDRLNPYENRCENKISLKGIELKGITEEEIRCCEYRMQWKCLYSYALNVCPDDEARDLKRFSDYNVENVLGPKCHEIKYGDGFCRNRSVPTIGVGTGQLRDVNLIGRLVRQLNYCWSSVSSLVLIWLMFEIKV